MKIMLNVADIRYQQARVGVSVLRAHGLGVVQTRNPKYDLDFGTTIEASEVNSAETMDTPDSERRWKGMAPLTGVWLVS